MVEKVGRNDPCPCGSGKKYKNCHWTQDQQKGKTTLAGRKFTAKVLSGGGVHKQQQASPEQAQQAKAAVDYSTLMERSFGEALHSHNEKPPVPENPSEYLSEETPKESS